MTVPVAVKPSKFSVMAVPVKLRGVADCAVPARNTALAAKARANSFRAPLVLFMAVILFMDVLLLI
jgi:hypothetical protein